MESGFCPIEGADLLWIESEISGNFSIVANALLAEPGRAASERRFLTAALQSERESAVIVGDPHAILAEDHRVHCSMRW